MKEGTVNELWQAEKKLNCFRSSSNEAMQLSSKAMLFWKRQTAVLGQIHAAQENTVCMGSSGLPLQCFRRSAFQPP